MVSNRPSTASKRRSILASNASKRRSTSERVFSSTLHIGFSEEFYLLSYLPSLQLFLGFASVIAATTQLISKIHIIVNSRAVPAESIPITVPTGTADFSQEFVEADMTSLKDGVPSDSTSSISSSGNATSGIKSEADQESIEEQGFDEMHAHLDVNADGSDKVEFLQQSVSNASEALPSTSCVSSSNDVHNGTTDSSLNAKSSPKSLALEDLNDLKSTDRSGNSASKSPKSMPDMKKEKKIIKKVPHLLFNFSEIGLSRTYKTVGKSPSLARQKQLVFPPTDNQPTGRAMNVSDRPMPRVRNTQREMLPEQTRGPSLASQKHVFPSTDYRPAGRALSVNNRTTYRDKLNWNTEREMAPELTCGASLASQKHHVFPHTDNQPIGRVLSANDRPMSRDKFTWNPELELSPELTRGPRCYGGNFHVEPSTVKETFELSVSRDKYNLPGFQTEYENAKFYVIKSFNEDDVHKSIKYNVWTSSPFGNNKLNAAFLDAEAKSSKTRTKCPVFLFFSVNGSGQFVGVAEMIGPVDFKKDMDFWKHNKYNGFFPIRWHILKDVPNTQFRYIILPNNDNHRVTYSRDTQEVELKQGIEMLNIFKRYLAKTSLLDDYDFYLNRDKLFRAQSSTKNTTLRRAFVTISVFSADDFTRGRKDETSGI
ncbi:YTH domain-containing protein ECT4 isoform X2 [Senna tora]|uniref:YTH domain-containing family protein n=1 Tax=Senna tora TaxID=362788 RepID=A0A834SGD9_9FABA|nr:YTH domain-containing protein ECT4 isoform X2 [Senna tora]